MKLKDIEKFAIDCFNNGVNIPKNLIVICEDWNEKVPEEHQTKSEIEYNVSINEDWAVSIQISPKKV